MARTQTPKPKGRLTRNDWIEAAGKMFVQGGVSEVKVDKLARRLKVTRGSFYWHFKDRQDLLDALLTQWLERNRGEIEALRNGPAGEAAAFEHLLRLWLTQDASIPAYDIAVRGWARRSEAVAAAVLEVDHGWIELLDEALRGLGYSSPESIVRARIFYFHQIGYARYAVSAQETLEQRIAWASLYYKAFIGWDPDPGFIDRLTEFAAKQPKKRFLAIPKSAPSFAGR